MPKKDDSKKGGKGGKGKPAPKRQTKVTTRSTGPGKRKRQT